MPSRRTFLAGAGALCATPLWSAVGNPTHVAAAKHFDGSFWLHGLSADGRDLFAIPLTARGHAAAAHPTRAEAVAFARRPGTFALVLDCADGRVIAELNAPQGHHFYGHGTFSADGSRLYTTENAYDRGVGRIGVWDATSGYRRVASLPSHGIGPHEIIRLPGRDTLVVANGGIETHPATGRTKLNLATMQPNLSYLGAEGELLEQVRLPSRHRLNSMRHIAAAPTGEIAIGCQWQGDLAEAPPLVWTHRQGGPVTTTASASNLWRQFNGYIGSVAWSGDGQRLIATSPRGGLAFVGSPTHEPRIVAAPDVCGAASANTGALLSAGKKLLHLDRFDHKPMPLASYDVESWDNHISTIEYYDRS